MRLTGSQAEHDQMVKELKEDLKRRYDEDFREYNYWESEEHKKMLGDLDYAGVYETDNGFGLDIYECKSGKGKSKARKQLKRAKKYFNEFFDEINCFRWIKGDRVEKLEI